MSRYDVISKRFKPLPSSKKLFKYGNCFPSSIYIVLMRQNLANLKPNEFLKDIAEYGMNVLKTWTDSHPGFSEDDLVQTTRHYGLKLHEQAVSDNIHYLHELLDNSILNDGSWLVTVMKPHCGHILAVIDGIAYDTTVMHPDQTLTQQNEMMQQLLYSYVSKIFFIRN